MNEIVTEMHSVIQLQNQMIMIPENFVNHSKYVEPLQRMSWNLLLLSTPHKT